MDLTERVRLALGQMHLDIMTRDSRIEELERQVAELTNRLEAKEGASNEDTG